MCDCTLPRACYSLRAGTSQSVSRICAAGSPAGWGLCLYGNIELDWFLNGITLSEALVARGGNLHVLPPKGESIPRCGVSGLTIRPNCSEPRTPPRFFDMIYFGQPTVIMPTDNADHGPR